MGSMISGIVDLSLQVIEAAARSKGMNLEEYLLWINKLTKRNYEAIRALMQYPQLESGWRKPGYLYHAKVCSQTKTTETWQELKELGVLEVKEKPTEIRLASDEKTIYLLLTMFQRRPEYFIDFLRDITLQPPQWFVDNKEAINNALKKMKEAEVKGKRKKTGGS